MATPANRIARGRRQNTSVHLTADANFHARPHTLWTDNDLMEVETRFDAGLSAHQAGRLDEADALYRQVIEVEPHNADAWHLLGVLIFQTGRAAEAIKLINHAIAIKPTAAAYFANLGMVLVSQGQLAEATQAYRHAIVLKPDFPEAHNNLAGVLRQLGALDESIGAYRQAIALRPVFAEAHNNLALILAEQGHLDEAIKLFRRAIALRPGYAEAHNNLGNVLLREGHLQSAVECWTKALSLNPALAEAHNNLGNALKTWGRIDEAIGAFRRALALQPNLPAAWNNLGVICHDKGQCDQAVESYQRAITLCPGYADAHYNLAIALHSQAKRNEAIAACRQALRINPHWPQACNNLGIWLTEIGQLNEALAAFDQALLDKEDYAEAHCNRGNALKQVGRVTEAIASHRRAVELKPECAVSLNNLGAALKQAGQLDEAYVVLLRAIELQPDCAEAHNNLANVLKDQGRLGESLAYYERAVALRPTDAAADSNRVYTLHFHQGYDAQDILNEHRLWNLRHAAPLRSERHDHDNQAFPRRRLRIGYVSPDFREHCQAMFTLPLFSHHDHNRFEIFCYSDVTAPDAITNRLRDHVDVWHNIVAMTDEGAAERIREDRIDILVDLTAHMAHNRLLTFARKPAPVQATWLGYPGTTGLETMDYRVSDPYLDPPQSDRFYSEHTIRLPDSFWCYDPLTSEPQVNALPASTNGFVTFGCLNNFCKLNDSTLRLWARVMLATPRSRLLLLAPEGSARLNVLEILAQSGIHSGRVQFIGRQSRRAYLELYHRIDLALDTFPYNGHTTTLDAFWMGVPTVTRIGSTAVGRGGFSLLSNLDLTDLAADSEEQFVEKAVALAADPHRLGALRQTLRDRLSNSPLCDAPRFAQNLETAYCGMWQTWSASRVKTGPRPRLKLTLNSAVTRRRAMVP